MGNALLGSVGGAIIGGSFARITGSLTEESADAAHLIGRGGIIGGAMVGGPAWVALKGMLQEHAAVYGQCRDEVDTLTNETDKEP